MWNAPFWRISPIWMSVQCSHWCWCWLVKCWIFALTSFTRQSYFTNDGSELNRCTSWVIDQKVLGDISAKVNGHLGTQTSHSVSAMFTHEQVENPIFLHFIMPQTDANSCVPESPVFQRWRVLWKYAPRYMNLLFDITHVGALQVSWYMILHCQSRINEKKRKNKY